MNKEKKIPGHILSLFIILLSISGVCLLMYKAQFRFNLHQPIEYVMMTTHKPTGTITLTSDSPVLTETFTCTVPELKMFTLEGTAKNKNSDARLFITLANADAIIRFGRYITTLKNCFPLIFKRASVNQAARTNATTICGTNPISHRINVFAPYLNISDFSRLM